MIIALLGCATDPVITPTMHEVDLGSCDNDTDTVEWEVPDTGRIVAMVVRTEEDDVSEYVTSRASVTDGVATIGCRGDADVYVTYWMVPE